VAASVIVEVVWEKFGSSFRFYLRRAYARDVHCHVKEEDIEERMIRRGLVLLQKSGQLLLGSSLSSKIRNSIDITTFILPTCAFIARQIAN
jgi:hypothetical protein